MPIGKDSIEKRVAKPDAETVSSTAVETESPDSGKKTAVKSESTASASKKSSSRKSTTGSTASKSSAKKTVADDGTAKSSLKATVTSSTEGDVKNATEVSKKVKSNVLSNIAPETVEKVIGHKEDEKYEKVSIGDDMPYYLM